MKAIGLIINQKKPRAREIVPRLAVKAAALGFELLADRETAEWAGRQVRPGLEGELDRIDALLAMGGDGTMLRAVRTLDGRDTPVIGVNLGGLGFLTSVTEGELEHALDCFARGEFTHTERTVLACTVPGRAGSPVRYRALNDIVVSSVSGRVVTLHVAVDGEEVSHFVADGLVVATPTGSTGHSLSAGGPVVLPATPAFLLTAICAHTLSTRPLVVPDRSEIRVTVAKSYGPVRMTCDGQVGLDVAEGDTVHIGRGQPGVRFLHFPGYSYFGVLRQKLHWRGSTAGE